MGLFLSDVIDASRSKPHSDGQTMILDRISSNPCTFAESISQYIDVAKIGWGIPFLLDTGFLEKWVNAWNDLGVGVSNGGTLLE